jgi:biotin carboxyl carrier protein
VAAGQTVEPGATIGLIEVMKFYYPVRYEGSESFVAGDYLLPNASPVSAGQGLLARA